MCYKMPVLKPIVIHLVQTSHHWEKILKEKLIPELHMKTSFCHLSITNVRKSCITCLLRSCILKHITILQKAHGKRNQSMFILGTKKKLKSMPRRLIVHFP